MYKTGQRIREARERKGWSQDELADRAKVSQQTIAKIESGATMRSRFLPVIANVLEIPLQDLDEAYAAQVRASALGMQSIGVHVTAPGRSNELLFVEEPIHHFVHPEMLLDRLSFALIWGDNSISPIAKTGDVLLCGAYNKKIIDGPCVLIGKPIPELNNSLPIRARASMMDLTLDDLGPMLALERLQPPGNELVPQSDWERIYKVYGVRFMR